MVKLTLISIEDTHNLVRIKLRDEKAHLVFFKYFNTRKSFNARTEICTSFLTEISITALKRYYTFINFTQTKTSFKLFLLTV